MELVINSLPNKSTGFSTFYLNYGHEPILPICNMHSENAFLTELLHSCNRQKLEFLCFELRRSVNYQKLGGWSGAIPPDHRRWKIIVAHIKDTLSTRCARMWSTQEDCYIENKQKSEPQHCPYPQRIY